MPHDVEERVGIEQLQGRHNVSQNAVTKNNSNVSTHVPIIPEEYGTRKSNSNMDGFKGFIKSFESS